MLPGHTDETTIGREWEENPFVRVWRGAEPEGTERVTVGGRDATLVVWSPDYDGKGKAWVRFDDGTDAIVGGSPHRPLTGLDSLPDCDITLARTGRTVHGWCRVT